MEGIVLLGVKVFNILPSYIKIESNNPKKFNLFVQNFFMKIHFILEMNILNFKKNYIYLILIEISIWKFRT
jgi:hypothetical protein